MSATFAPTAVSQPSSKRFKRIFVLLAAFVALLSAGVLSMGLYPFAPDLPAGNTPTNGEPGSGGLKRAFPAMALRADNPQTDDKVALGKLLYFDPILSGKNDMSCATCHHPEMGFSDARDQSMGFGGEGLGRERKNGAVIKRSAPTIWNAAYNHRQFWDGRAADLEEQAEGPIKSDKEMNQNPDELVAELK
ncbi:MAG: hypothetical protein HOP19_14880, partial [Acidobacteria bacterium]|nr:hypothetical protein [Acidobacteriota bacterium]